MPYWNTIYPSGGIKHVGFKNTIWFDPKSRGSLLEVPMMRFVVWVDSGPPNWGNYYRASLFWKVGSGDESLGNWCLCRN